MVAGGAGQSPTPPRKRAELPASVMCNSVKPCLRNSKTLVAGLLDQHDAVGNALADEATHDTRQAVLQELHTQAGHALADAVLTHTWAQRTCIGEWKKPEVGG